MLYQTQVTISSTGTAVALATSGSTTQPLHATWVQIQSYSANNTAGLTVGGKPSPPTVASGANPGVVLAPSQIQFLPAVGSPGPYHLTEIYVNGTTGDIANVLYFKR
jgi:hypothetical protein